MKSFARIALLFLLVVATPLAVAQTRGPALVIEAPPKLERTAAKIRALEQERLEHVSKFLGLNDPGRPIIVVLAADDSPMALSAPPWVSGYTDGVSSVVVLIPSRATSYPNDGLEELLHHEIAHVLITRASGGNEVPRWFNEGLALVVGRFWSFDDRTRFILERAMHIPASLEEVDRGFMESERSAARSYAFAGAFVQEIMTRYGQDAPARILAAMRRGVSFNTAFRYVSGRTLIEVEREYWKAQTPVERWVPIVTSLVTGWGVITLLAIWAIRKRRRRDAAVLAQWEAEESAAEKQALAEWKDDEEPVN